MPVSQIPLSPPFEKGGDGDIFVTMTTRDYITICPFAGCHQDCVLKVFVQDGRAVKLESVEMPGEPGERRSCLRGLAALRWVYHPDRLQFPLKRVGERGEGKWQRVSWDEALDGIASKLLEIKERYGAQALKVMAGGSSSVGTVMGRFMGIRFANAWGAGGAFEGKGYTSDGGIPAALLLALGDSYPSHDCRDYLNSKMVIWWGGNPAATCIPEMRYYLDAREKGAKLVSISPIYHASAAKADVWAGVKPATDAALALGMLNVIFHKRLYDSDYVLRHTVAPFLVREDTGYFLRDSDSEKPLAWDEAAGAARPHHLVRSPALFGRHTIGEVRCRTAFELLEEHAAGYPLERAAAICGVSPEMIERLAVDYAASKPAAIRLYHGMARTLNSNLALRAIISLAAVTGNIGVPGGGVSMPDWSGYPVELNTRGVAMPAGAPGQKILPGSKNAIRAWRLIAGGEPYPVKALILSYQNPVQNYGHAGRYREIFAGMDLIVVSDMFMTYTARFADYVLPEATTLERADIAISKNHLVRMEKAIEPVGEAKSPLEIWGSLARRVGLSRFFQAGEEEMSRTLLDSKHDSVKGITLDRLDSEKIVRAGVPEKPYVPFEDRQFPTPTGRIELYVESQVPFGEGLPFYREPLETTVTPGQLFPLRFLTIKSKLFVHSQLPNVDWMRELDPAPWLAINPLDAAQRGISNGDSVTVYNGRGSVTLKAKITRMAPPGTVNADHGWWPDHYRQGHYNSLLHAIDDPAQINPALEIDQVVKDMKAASHMVHYDCLVEVRKEVGS